MATLRELRKTASAIGIKKYSRLTKSQLILEITRKSNAIATIEKVLLSCDSTKEIAEIFEAVTDEKYTLRDTSSDTKKDIPIVARLIAMRVVKLRIESRGNSWHNEWKKALNAYEAGITDSQPEIPATADDAISATDNDTALASQPAVVVSTECETSAQPENLYYDEPYSDYPGDNSYPDDDIPEMHTPDDNPGFTVIPADEAVILRETEHFPAMDIPPEDIIREPYFPPEKFTTIWASDLGSGSFAYKIAKKDYTLNYVVRLVNSGYEENSNYRKWTGEKLLMFYNCNADSSRPFACYSPMLGIFNFSHSSEIFFNKFNNQQNFINHFMPALNDFLRPTDLLDNNGEIISDGLEAFRYLFSKATILDRSCRDDNFTMPENPFTNDNDKDNPLSWRESPYRVKALRIMHTIIYTTVDATRVWNWDKSAVKKLNKRIQALTAELHKLFDAQNVSMPADNTAPACDIPAHNSAAAVVPYAQAASIRKFFHIIALYLRLWLAMNISRRDIAISMPVIIPATVNDITPQQPTKKECATASVHDDIEHKLIDTKDLHFAEKRKALDHNATVITSCMFPEAVISLLMSISAKAILQLGFHMRLFIAKPKGTKKVIAELFANRLIDSRKSRANVRTKSGNFTAKSPANIPDGVKFFVGAKRQICFKFDDSQLDLPFDD